MNIQFRIGYFPLHQPDPKVIEPYTLAHNKMNTFIFTAIKDSEVFKESQYFC